MTRGWRVHLLALTALAVAAHLATLWAFPRLVMHKVVSEVPTPSETERAYFPPPTDHAQRRIVMPSPDLLYATCSFDLAKGPLVVRADPRLDSYWSVALYADNTDNFEVVNDRTLADEPLALRLLAPGSVAATGAPGERAIVSPSTRGLLLMRVLVTAERPFAELDAARRSLVCRTQTARS
jgi:uncharacterized membrane protein